MPYSETSKALHRAIKKCSSCGSTYKRNKGVKNDFGNHICVNCQRQFIKVDDPKRCSEDIKLDPKSMGFRAIERVKGLGCITQSATIIHARQTTWTSIA